MNTVKPSIAIFSLILMITGVSSGQNEAALSPGRIVKLIPNKIKGYSLRSDPKSKLITVGKLRYSMAEKNFGSGRKSIKILLFDYREAPVMLNQVTRKWDTYTPVTSDSLIHQSVDINNCQGWEMYNIINRNSQIVLSIFERYYLTIEGKNIELESLKLILQDFKLESFPR
jgi:hypothetical protein